jgi:hypothetical protein
MTCCTTLNRIREKIPCESGWTKLLRHLGKTKADNELLPFSVIVESNGLDDALWCCRSVDYDRVWRLYAVWCARQVQHLMTDAPSIAALDAAQDYAIGLATRYALAAAGAAAGAAASAWSAAGAAAGAAAWSAARAAARAAAGADARYAQQVMFLRVVSAPNEEAAVQILLAVMPKRVREAA